VQGDGAAAIAPLLEGRVWLKSLETAERTLRITVTDLPTAQREIPAAIAAAGVALRRFEIEEASLEESMTASQPGVVIKLPSPTAIDAYAQFLKNLDQFVLIAVVITGAGVVSGERSSGTAILVLTKPLSRGAFVVAKILSQVALLVAATTLGTVACVGVTAVVFGAAHEARLVTVVALWLLYAVLLIVVMTLFSAAFRSRGAAAGAGLGFFFLTLLLSSWGPMARYSFLGLFPAMRDALMGEAMSLGWPVTTAMVAIVVGVVAAVRIFERQEL
jgi:ABC-2 type transport system permease protein